MAGCSIITNFPPRGINGRGRHYRFMCVDIGSYGKDCGSTIFKRSTLWTSIQTNMLELPSERPLSGTEGPNVPHFFVGDERFALNRNILRPFGGSNLSVKVCNYRLSRTRFLSEPAMIVFSLVLCDVGKSLQGSAL